MCQYCNVRVYCTSKLLICLCSICLKFDRLIGKEMSAVLHAWRRETYLSILCAAKKGHVCMHVRKQNVTGVAYTVSDLLHWAHSLKKCRSSYHESSIRFLFKTKPSDLHVHSMSWWGSSYCVPSASLSSYHELFLVFLFETRHAPFFMLYFLHWFILFYVMIFSISLYFFMFLMSTCTCSLHYGSESASTPTCTTTTGVILGCSNRLLFDVCAKK